MLTRTRRAAHSAVNATVHKQAAAPSGQEVSVQKYGLKLAVVVGGVSLLAASAQAQISTSAWYSAVNKNSNKCIDAAGSGTANGTAVQQYACNGTSAQNWQFQATSGGYYKVVTRNNT